MSILSLDSHHRSGHPTFFSLSGIAAHISARWHEYRLMRSIEAGPYDVMKDVGFPAAENTNEK